MGGSVEEFNLLKGEVRLCLGMVVPKAIRDRSHVSFTFSLLCGWRTAPFLSC